MTDTVLRKSYKTHWLIILLVTAVFGTGAILLGVQYWAEIKSIAILYALVRPLVRLPLCAIARPPADSSAKSGCTLRRIVSPVVE